MGERVQNFLMSPPGGGRIERKAWPEIRHGDDRPLIGLQYLAPAAPEDASRSGRRRRRARHLRPEGSELAKPLASFFIGISAGQPRGSLASHYSQRKRYHQVRETTKLAPGQKSAIAEGRWSA
jgi:hypothetical protein